MLFNVTNQNLTVFPVETFISEHFMVVAAYILAILREGFKKK